MNGNPLCRLSSSPILDRCEQSKATWVCVVSTLWLTGADRELIAKVKHMYEGTFLSSGIRGVASLTKGWSNCVRSILADDQFVTTHVGYCKRARNCVHALREAGLSETEVNIIVNRYDGVCGIPPILLSQPYCRVLLPNQDKSVYDSVIPLSNLGRSSPQADDSKCIESELSFYETTSLCHRNKFDLTKISASYGRLCGRRASAPIRSRVETSSHSSFEFPRSAGGKTEEIRRSVYDTYLYLTIDELVPVAPVGNLYDVLGNLVMMPSEWEAGKPACDCLYLYLGAGQEPDRRFGLFILDWAIRKLRDFGVVHSDSPFFSFGYAVPKLEFDGELQARVSALSEEGFKARIITITQLCAAIAQIVARHILDPYVRADPLVKIGLLSSVKLYDLMVKLSGGDRRGVESFDSPSFFCSGGLSADLTTSTDTGYREGISSLLTGFCSSLGLGELQNFVDFCIGIASSRRRFVSPRVPDDHVHRCGIMMGEALTGVYLNVLSGIVRCTLTDLIQEFSYYDGSSSDDADVFIDNHFDLIQDWLDGVDISNFHNLSSQSGDDLIIFDWSDPLEMRRFSILLYRILGCVPSESTYYSSENYVTFTEEAAVKCVGSLGWVFIDTIKPRLLRPMDADGAESIISRIRQIGNSCRYLHDQAVLERICDCVDLMISSSPMIRDRIKRYQLVPSLPAEFGGLGHPERYLDGSELDIPIEDRNALVRIATCSNEQLFEIKYSWALEDLEERDADEMREILLHIYPERCLLERQGFPGATEYFRELDRVKRDMGFASMDDLVSHVSSAVRLQMELEDPSDVVANPMVKLRNRREFLISKTADLVGDGHGFTWHTASQASFRMNSTFRGTVVLKDDFLETVGLQDLPSLSIPIGLSTGGV